MPSASSSMRAMEPGGSRWWYSGGTCTAPSRPTTTKSSPRLPSAPTRPSLIVTVRLSASLTAVSCVTTTAVVPSAAATSLISSTTRVPDSSSSWLVGSSARSSLGALASATARESRCCSPPDSCPAGRPPASARPTLASRSRARRRSRRTARWAKAMFWAADR
ncbi:hypothetical protein BKM31_08045 [[Actinomadura] parvosata subsp. kistnae]|uniref:Uncharacterized protein n=1 Tax=[Actinomadura] parvosata subsp. kistnae TaxID=1909395 RepID=A0A1U9ZU05_9ACTN|nr:hypothetical protein BKM31_08045 [Nonomuraea sp. ATCC 55076]